MANQKQRKEKRRSARLQTKARHRTEEVDVEEVDETEPEIEEKEVTEKEYYPYPMAYGPTSWEELEALKVAKEKAEIVREVTYSVQDLVSNILYADMSPEQKSKAIRAVGDGFGEKVKQAEKHEKMEKGYDLDILEIDAIIAKDARHLGLGERVSDWIQKAGTSKLSDSDFALVIDNGDEGKVRHYPINNKANTRNSLIIASQMLKKGGGEYADTKTALPALYVAAKGFGIGTVEKSSSAVIVEKDKTGNWRAVMWPSNNFIDWDGDIISEVAHKEYVEWVNENMEFAPMFMTWHKPGTMRKSRVDYVGYENGFLLMSAPLEETEAAALLKAYQLTDIGMSHGTIVLERDQNDPRVVLKYRMVEVSDLPLSKAANPFTDFETLLKEADMPKGLDTKEYLVTLLGAEEAEKFITKAGIKQKALQDAGIESKEKSDTPAAETAPVEKQESVNIETVAAQVFERVSKELDIEGLNAYLTNMQANAEKVPVLEALVKEMRKSTDDKLAEMLTPPAASSLVWAKARKSQSTDTVLDPEKNKDDEKLEKAKPELGWLSEATGTTPVQS